MAEFKSKVLKEQVNTDFTVQTQAGSFVLKLDRVEEHVKTERHENFSLFFHGSAQPFLSQAIYKLNHTALGEMEIFLVPVARTQGGFEYEAVFNLVS